MAWPAVAKGYEVAAKLAPQQQRRTERSGPGCGREGEVLTINGPPGPVGLPLRQKAKGAAALEVWADVEWGVLAALLGA